MRFFLFANVMILQLCMANVSVQFLSNQQRWNAITGNRCIRSW